MKVKLGDLTKIRTGKLDANAASENGKYPFFTCSKEPLRISTYSYDCECVLVAGNGDLNTKYYNGKFDAYQRTYIIESNSDRRLYLPYLYYFMTRYIQDLRRLSIGGVIKYIKLGNLTDAEISLPDIEEQKVACKKLEKVKNIIDKKESQLFYLDNLIKARFVEMFGDPSKGDKIKTDKRKIGEIATVTKLAGFEFTKNINYQEEGDIIMLRGLNCKNGHLVLDDIKWIDQAISDALPRSKLYKGDILMTYAGTIGDVAMVDKDNTYHLAPNVSKISINNTNEINPVFLTQLFLNTHDYIMSFASQVAQASINMQKIRDFDYYFPPIELQNQFAAFVAQVDKSKFALSNELAMGNFYIRLIHDCIMHGCIDL